MFQLAGPVQSELEIKKSRFIGHLYPVESRAAAKEILAGLRARHPDAVHVCWALICPGDFGLDDDGEPSGTAARPMYTVLTHKQLENVLAVVVRYWGGIKLGAGGLARAYGQSISDACKVATLVPVDIQCRRSYALAFPNESSFRRHCEQHHATIVNASYGEQVELEIQISAASVDAFERSATDLLRGDLQRRDPA